MIKESNKSEEGRIVALVNNYTGKPTYLDMAYADSFLEGTLVQNISLVPNSTLYKITYSENFEQIVSSKHYARITDPTTVRHRME